MLFYNFILHTTIFALFTGVFVIRIPKEIPGEKFDGLDMLTKLMAPSGANSASEPSIQTIGMCLVYSSPVLVFTFKYTYIPSLVVALLQVIRHIGLHLKSKCKKK